MLTTLVTCLESCTQYFLIPHLCSRPGHAVAWLQSPAEQGAQHFLLSSHKSLLPSSSRKAVRSLASYGLTVSDLFSSYLRHDGKRIKSSMHPPLIAVTRM